MNISVILILACCFGSMAMPNTARAESAQISFSGAVVDPTCSPPAPAAKVLSASHATQRMTCASPGEVSGNPGTYVLTTQRLTGEQADKVLNYFDAYIKAGRSGAGDPILLVQVYN